MSLSPHARFDIGCIEWTGAGGDEEEKAIIKNLSCVLTCGAAPHICTGESSSGHVQMDHIMSDFAWLETRLSQFVADNVSVANATRCTILEIR